MMDHSFFFLFSLCRTEEIIWRESESVASPMTHTTFGITQLDASKEEGEVIFREIPKLAKKYLKGPLHL